jgi:DNA-damage-inducible protein D
MPCPTILLTSTKWSTLVPAVNVKSIEAKDFAAEITIFNAREHRMSTEPAISHEHITNNEAVRKTLLSRGIRPESLPAAEDVKKVERRLVSEDKKSLKNPKPLDS